MYDLAKIVSEVVQIRHLIKYTNCREIGLEKCYKNKLAFIFLCMFIEGPCFP